MADKLFVYKSKRNKKKTPEPFSLIDVDSKHLVFVVQKHQARVLHYDFRLEVGGVMPSWAIPKGPSLDPKVKRLAIATEDHPLDYRKFEGVIPEGNYGAGKVMIWDKGTYFPELEEEDMRVRIKDKREAEKIMKRGILDGELKFFLKGRKLNGSFVLVKTKGFGGRNAWLLIKHKDKFVQEEWDAADYDLSEVSGRSIDEIS